MKKRKPVGLILLWLVFILAMTAASNSGIIEATDRYGTLNKLVNANVKAGNYETSAPTNYSVTLNVKSGSFKAAGDGKTDDTAAIQKALNKAKSLGGGVVYLPEGTYKTSNNIYIYSDTKLLGDRAKIVRSNVNKDNAVLVISASQQDVVVEGLIISNTKTSSGIGIDLHANVKNVWITNNIFTGVKSQAVNINSTGIKHVQVSGNHFEKVTYGVLTNSGAKDVTDVRIVNNQFIDIYGDAIELNHAGEAYQSGSQFVIANNYISVPKGVGKSVNSGFGVGISGATNVTIIGNIFEKVRYEAIHIEDEAKHITIVGNIINGVQNDPDTGLNSGIYIIDGDYITIADNSIYRAHDYGIHLEQAIEKQATSVVITGNTVTDNSSGGIRVAGYSGESNITVSNNIVTRNKGNGIIIDGEIRNLKVTDNIVNDNTGFGMFLKKSGLGWYISGNSFYGNKTGDIGYGSEYRFPVPIRNQNKTVVVDAKDTKTDWTNAFTLGAGSEGLLYVTAKQGTAYSTKLYQLSWNGSKLTISQIAHDKAGSVEVLEPRMNGRMLQVQAFSSTAGKVALDIQFEGLTLLK